MKLFAKIVSGLLALTMIFGLSLSALAADTYTFSDVPAESWYAEAVHWCKENDVMNGTSDSEFSPNETMTRAMLATVLYRAEGSPAVGNGGDYFTDTKSGSYYSNAVSWAAETNLINGYGNGLFGTNDPVTREQLATILWRYADSPNGSDAETFADDSAIASYAKAAVTWARSDGIISGKGNNIFDPQGDATRAQVAVILQRYLENILSNKKPTPTPPVESTPTPTPIPTPTPVPSPTPDEGGSNLETTTYKLNGVSFTMVLVEGGTFTMGANDRVGDQAPEHEVTLSSYLMGETEVTQALWQEVMGSNPSGSNRGADYPVENVTWTKSHDFVEKLNERMHAEGLIPDDMNFYMPSEAQWEYAAKGGNQSKGYVYSGSDTLSEVGWTSNEHGRVSHKVKLKLPNELGLYDMSGNVYEWVADYYAPYSANAQTDPCNLTNINTSRQVIKRGGSFWYNDAYRYTCTYRYAYYENVTDESIGLRICLY